MRIELAPYSRNIAVTSLQPRPRQPPILGAVSRELSRRESSWRLAGRDARCGPDCAKLQGPEQHSAYGADDDDDPWWQLPRHQEHEADHGETEWAGAGDRGGEHG